MGPRGIISKRDGQTRLAHIACVSGLYQEMAPGVGRRDADRSGAGGDVCSLGP